MNKILAYHHHSSYSFNENREIMVLKIHGVFIEELAKYFTKIVLFLYETPPNSNKIEDYALISPKIEIISLGYKFPLYIRYLKIISTMKILLSHNFDILLIRSPTPLFPIINLLPKLRKKSIPLIVGDYLDDIGSVNNGIIKSTLIILWIFIYQVTYIYAITRSKKVLVNNPYNAKKLNKYNKNIKIVSTSLVSFQNIIHKNSIQFERVIKILYVGRIDMAKGLSEMIEAIAHFKQFLRNTTILFEIIGWDASKSESVKKELQRKAIVLNVNNEVLFTSKIPHGEELYKKYQEADIFYIGSKYSEGFPRVIWEAFASFTPVISSRVGGINYYLSDKHIYFLNKVDADSIVSTVNLIITNPSVAYHKALNAHFLVKKFTIEKSVNTIYTELIE